MTKDQDSKTSSPSPAASAGAPLSNGRTPSKVAFRDGHESYEYESQRRRSTSGSSDGSEPSSSYSSDTSSDDRHSRHRPRTSNSRRRQGYDRRHGERTREGHGGPGHRKCSRKAGRQSTSGTHYETSSAAVFAGGPSPGTGGPAAAPLQLAMHPQQGMVCMGAVAQPCCTAAQTQAQQALALLPPPGSSLLYPGCLSPVGTPTKAYTSPRSAQDPAPTLLMMSPPPCAGAAGAQPYLAPRPPLYPPAPGPPGSPLPAPMPMPAQPQPGVPQGPWQHPCCLSQSLQAMSLNANHAGSGQPASPPPPSMSYAHMQQLPPPPPLPLSLPVLPPPAVVSQQQAAAGLAAMYDETTQEVVLADGVMARELGRQGHALVPLPDAYRTKLAALQASVNGPLLAKREALVQQHARLAARAGEVAAQRAALEREIATLADDMLGRVRSAESLRQVLLGREQSAVGDHLDGIQRLLADIVAAAAAGPVDFLNNYRRLEDTCARLVSRPFKTEVDVSAADLPAEAAVYGDLASAHGALTQLLEVKDTMIAHLLRERDELKEELQQVVERYTAELAALDAQCNTYYQRLVARGEGINPSASHMRSRLAPPQAPESLP